MRFLGHETRSVPLPKNDGFSRFGTVSIRTYSQALSRLSWLSFSSPGFSPGRRGWLDPGCICHRMQTPHGSQVERANWPDPPGRDSIVAAACWHNYTRFGHHGLVQTICSHLASTSSEVFLRRPSSANTLRQWDRTHGLLLPTWEGITRKSLPRTGRATLMASSSTGEQHRQSFDYRQDGQSCVP